MARASSGMAPGNTVSGSVIYYSNANGSATSGRPNVGTWRAHGYVGTSNNEQLTIIWQRIS